MKTIFKRQTYLVTPGQAAQKIPGIDVEISDCFSRAALKEGFGLTKVKAACKEVGVFWTEENITFDELQKVMNEVSAATGLSLFVSNWQDVLGESLQQNPAGVKQEAFLRSKPAR